MMLAWVSPDNYVVFLSPSALASKILIHDLTVILIILIPTNRYSYDVNSHVSCATPCLAPRLD